MLSSVRILHRKCTCLRLQKRSVEQNSNSDSPLRRLLRDASAFGEADPAKAPEGELFWATQPYAAGSRSSDQPNSQVDPTETTVLLFPGQGSQRVGMGKCLENVPSANELYELASSVVGWDVAKVCRVGPEEELQRRCQTAVLVTSLAALELARDTRPGALERVRAVAGFSLGEITAMVYAGVLQMEQALHLVEVRSAAMEAASRERAGGMLTVWLTPDAKLGELLYTAKEQARTPTCPEPVCQVANYLFPGCKVLAGDEEALRYVERSGRRHGVRRCARVRVSGAFHTPLMARAEAAVREALRSCDVAAPRVPIVSCVDAKTVTTAGGASWRLARLTGAAVRWEQVLHALYARPRGTAQPFTLAVGPGSAHRATLKLVNARAWDASLLIDV